ncbi:ComF family protein [candidate division KSB1 bacterium]|nr:ComF family protein [candidate division KSB1 bacterium]
MYLDKAVAFCDFNDDVQVIIHLFKYEGMVSLSDNMAKIIAGAFQYDLDFQVADLIIPVPLNLSRKRERGYNQSELLGKTVSRLSGVKMEHKAMRRVRDTKTQTKLNHQQRLKNVSNAFKIKSPQIIAGKSIILLDDVITTGATMNACAKALKDAGAKNVLALALVKA